MHALVWRVALDPEREEDVQRGLHEMLVPMTKAAPGFQKGFWLRNAENEGLALVLFDTREHAEADSQGGPPPDAPADPPFTVKSVDIYELVAEA